MKKRLSYLFAFLVNNTSYVIRDLRSRGLAVVIFPQAVEPLVTSPGAIPSLPVRGSPQAHHLRPVLGVGLSLLRACRRSNRRPQDAFGTGDHL